MKASTLDAILAINPDAKFTTSKDNEGVETIEWLEGTTPISDNDIANKKAELNTAWSHIAPRTSAYNSLGGWREQLDMMYHDQVNGTTTWKDAIAQVKADNPKSE